MTKTWRQPKTKKAPLGDGIEWTPAMADAFNRMDVPTPPKQLAAQPSPSTIRVPKRVTEAMCRRLAAQMDTTARTSVSQLTDGNWWACVETDQHGLLTGSEHVHRGRALRALYAALSVLGEGK